MAESIRANLFETWIEDWRNLVVSVDAGHVENSNLFRKCMGLLTSVSFDDSSVACQNIVNIFRLFLSSTFFGNPYRPIIVEYLSKLSVAIMQSNNVSISASVDGEDSVEMAFNEYFLQSLLPLYDLVHCMYNKSDLAGRSYINQTLKRVCLQNRLEVFIDSIVHCTDWAITMIRTGIVGCTECESRGLNFLSLISLQVEAESEAIDRVLMSVNLDEINLNFINFSGMSLIQELLDWRNFQSIDKLFKLASMQRARRGIAYRPIDFDQIDGQGRSIRMMNCSIIREIESEIPGLSSDIEGMDDEKLLEYIDFMESILAKSSKMNSCIAHLLVGARLITSKMIEESMSYHAWRNKH